MISPRLIQWAGILATTTTLVGLSVAIEGQAAPNDWAGAPHTIAASPPPDLPDVAAVMSKDPLTPIPEKAASRALTLAQIIAAGNTRPDAQQSVVNVPAFPSGLQVPNPGPNGMPMGTITNQSAASPDIYVVTTVVGGRRPARALIQNGSDTEIVNVGDQIGTRRITRIVTQGVEFDDGSRVAVSPGQNSGVSAETDTFSTKGAGAQATQSGAIAGVTGGTPPITTPVTAAPQIPNQPTVQSNGTPVVNASPYPFGPLPTPAPGTTPAPVPHYFGPQPANGTP
jgi:hypothetical protein